VDFIVQDLKKNGTSEAKAEENLDNVGVEISSKMQDNVEYRYPIQDFWMTTR